MSRTRSFAAPLLLLAALLLSLLGSPAFAGEGSEQTSAIGPASKPVSSGPLREAQSIRGYWTAARMRSARPATPIRDPASQRSLTEQATAVSGPRVDVPPAAAKGVSRGGSERQLLHAGSVLRPYTNYPDRLNGKVFFSSGGGNFVCSGTAVNSENKSIVWTAGHCVHGGRGGTFHQNWAFVPAYSSSFNGHRPYGTWTARELWTLNGWSANSNFRHDLGAVVVNRVGGTRLVDRIGGQGITFNASANQRYSALGYPQAAPFNGLLQWRCDSGLRNRDFPPGSGPATMRIHCNMTGGASGGGWLARIDSRGLGYVHSVNSYKYSNDSDSMYGPYQDNGGLNLFNTVRNRPA